MYVHTFADTYVCKLHKCLFLQGNYANQEVLYYHQIIDVINHILQITDQQCSTNVIH